MPGLSQAQAPLGIASVLTLTASGFTGGSVTWSSSNTAAGTVDSRGDVTGVAPGVTTITATGVSVPAETATAIITVQNEGASLARRTWTHRSR